MGSATGQISPGRDDSTRRTYFGIAPGTNIAKNALIFNSQISSPSEKSNLVKYALFLFSGLSFTQYCGSHRGARSHVYGMRDSYWENALKE